MHGIKAGQKVTTTIASGLAWPGVAVSDEAAESKTVINKSTGQPVDITVTRFDVISLRETRPDADGNSRKYLALTSEVGQYGFRPVATARFSTVVGLDATEDGEVIDLQALQEMHGKAYSEFAAAQFAARNGLTDAASL